LESGKWEHWSNIIRFSRLRGVCKKSRPQRKKKNIIPSWKKKRDEYGVEEKAWASSAEEQNKMILVPAMVRFLFPVYTTVSGTLAGVPASMSVGMKPSSTASAESAESSNPIGDFDGERATSCTGVCGVRGVGAVGDAGASVSASDSASVNADGRVGVAGVAKRDFLAVVGVVGADAGVVGSDNTADTFVFFPPFPLPSNIELDRSRLNGFLAFARPRGLPPPPPPLSLNFFL